MASSLDGLSPKVPLYKVTEGNEPCFFTTYFSWDPAKAMVFTKINLVLNSTCVFFLVQSVLQFSLKSARNLENLEFWILKPAYSIWEETPRAIVNA